MITNSYKYVKDVVTVIALSSLLQAFPAEAGNRTALNPTQAVSTFDKLCLQGGKKTAKIKRAVKKDGNYTKHSSSGITNSFAASHTLLAIDVEAMFDKGCQITFAASGPTTKATKEIAALLMKQANVNKPLDQKSNGSTIFETKKGRIQVINFSQINPNHIQIGLL